MIWFNTYSDSSGNFIVEPSKIPETKEEAILSIKALELYSSDGSKPYLNVENSSEYFERIMTLINS
jgi:hypothetical protein